MRDPYFDNAKFILIALVVIGHIMAPLMTHSTACKTLYIWIYIFHMPAFALISGYFAKNILQHNCRKTITKYLCLYVVDRSPITPYSNRHS